MSSVPIWLTGRGVSLVQLQVTQPDAAGALPTNLTTYALTVLVDEIEFTPRQSSENVVNLTSVRENSVPTELEGTLILTEILQSQSSATKNCLAEAWASGNDYAFVTITRGGNSWVCAGVMSEYRESIAKGKSTGRLTVQLVNLGNGANVNPVYS